MAESVNLTAPKRSAQAVQGSMVSNQGYESTVVDDGVSSFAKGLGSALGQFSSDNGDSIRAQQTLDASFRQGEELAMNEVDADNKRSGIALSLFGQDAGWAEADRRLATNAVREEGIKTTANMNEHARLTPKEFREQLSTQKKALLEKYDDKDTRLSVSATFDETAQGLARVHGKEHQGLIQLTNRKNVSQELRLSIDSLNQHATFGISTPEAATKLITKPVDDILSGRTKPSTMSDFAHNQMIAESLYDQLEQGNVGWYRAIKSYGYDKFDDKQLKALETAKGKYTKKLNDDASVIVEELEWKASNAKSIKEVDAIYAQGFKELSALDTRSLDTTFLDTEGYVNERNEARANQYTYTERLRQRAKEQKAAVDKAAKTEAKADQAEANVIAVRLKAHGTTDTTTTDGKADALVQIPLSKQDGDIAVNTAIAQDVKKAAGMDDSVSDQEISLKILTDDKSADAAMRMWTSSQFAANLVKNAFVPFVESDLSTLTDEKGQVTPDAIKMLARMQKFNIKNPEKFSKMLGPTGYDHYLGLQTGIGAGHTVEKINSDRALYDSKKAEGSTTYQHTYNAEGEQVSKDTFVKDALAFDLGKTIKGSNWYGGEITSRVNGTPTGAAVATANRLFNKGLVMYDNDPYAAKQYMLDIVKNSAETITLGANPTHVVMGADRVQRNLDMNIGDILNYGDDTGHWADTILGIVGETRGLDKKDHKGFTKLSDISNLNITTIPGYSGLFLSTPTSNAPYPINLDQLQELQGMAQEAKNVAESNAIEKKKNDYAVANQLESTKLATDLNPSPERRLRATQY